MKSVNLPTNRSGILSFFFFPCLIIDVNRLSDEVNITCVDDGYLTTKGWKAFIYMCLWNLIYFGWLYWLVYMAEIVWRLEKMVARNDSTQEPELTTLHFVMASIFGVFTLFIWNCVVHFKFYKLWNQVNSIYNKQKVTLDEIIEENVDTRKNKTSKDNVENQLIREEYHKLMHKAYAELLLLSRYRGKVVRSKVYVMPKRYKGTRITETIEGMYSESSFEIVFIPESITKIGLATFID